MSRHNQFCNLSPSLLGPLLFSVHHLFIIFSVVFVKCSYRECAPVIGGYFGSKAEFKNRIKGGKKQQGGLRETHQKRRWGAEVVNNGSFYFKTVQESWGEERAKSEGVISGQQTFIIALSVLLKLTFWLSYFIFTFCWAGCFPAIKLWKENASFC